MRWVISARFFNGRWTKKNIQKVVIIKKISFTVQFKKYTSTKLPLSTCPNQISYNSFTHMDSSFLWIIFTLFLKIIWISCNNPSSSLSKLRTRKKYIIKLRICLVKLFSFLVFLNLINFNNFFFCCWKFLPEDPISSYLYANWYDLSVMWNWT